MAAPFARGRLLDVGCGDKPYESLFLPHVREYVGAEYDATYQGTSNEDRGRADVSTRATSFRSVTVLSTAYCATRLASTSAIPSHSSRSSFESSRPADA